MLATASIRSAWLTMPTSLPRRMTGQAFDTMGFHYTDGLVERSIIRHGDRIARHHVVHFEPVRSDVIVGCCRRTEQRIEPARAFALGADLWAV
jgi:hypothetical protein